VTGMSMARAAGLFQSPFGAYSSVIAGTTKNRNPIGFEAKPVRLMLLRTCSECGTDGVPQRMTGRLLSRSPPLKNPFGTIAVWEASIAA
jgi:hypothetical protein